MGIATIIISFIIFAAIATGGFYAIPKGSDQL
jgi:hypothetical protein